MKKKNFLTVVFTVMIMVVLNMITVLADTSKDVMIGEAFSADSGDELLTGDFNISYTFHNEGTVGANYNNFAIEFYSDMVSTGVTGKGYLSLRADAFGWWADGWTDAWGEEQTEVNDNWTGVFGAFGSDEADEQWQEAMLDADVIVTASRIGETINVKFDIKAANGIEYNFSNTIENVYGFGETLKVHLTGEEVTLSNIVFSPDGSTGGNMGNNPGGNENSTNTKKELTVGAAFSSNSGDESLTGDFEIVYTFHNKGTVGANYNNFAIEFYGDTVNTKAAKRGFLTLRADAWGWWAEGWGQNGGKTPADVNAGWTGVAGVFGSTVADVDWQEAMSDVDVTVTAVRKDETITVTYDMRASNGETYKFSNSIKNVYGYGDTVKVHLTGEKVKLTDIVYTVKYHQGTGNNPGNNPGSNGNGTSDSSGNKNEGNNTQVKQYTVTFQPNTGAAAIKSKVKEGQKAAPPKRLSRKGYTLTGWYQGNKKYNFSKAVKSNITLKAKWKKVTVKAAKLKQVSNVKGRKLSVKIKKISDVHGYQVSYATNKKFKSAKKRTTAATTMTLTKLIVGKSYYVRVRAYKLDSTGEKVYGEWSKSNRVKIKKS